MICPISANNVLNLKLRTGYSAYLQNPGFNHFYIGPETVLGFEIYAGDFRVEVHDRCSLLENNYEDPTVVGSGGYTRLENGAGVGALWDLNQVLLSAGYDHINYISYAGGDGTTSLFPDSASETVTASVGGRLRSECFAGVEASGTLFHYAQSGRAFSDARQATSGPFLEAQISEYLFGRAGAGYSVYSPEDGTASIVSNNDGWYAHLDLTHKASRLLDYTLSAGKNVSFGLYSGTIDLAYARLRANWHLIRKLGLSTSFIFEHGAALPAGGETFGRYGPGVSIDRVLAEGLTGTLAYQFYRRDSTLSGRDYAANMLLAHLTYEF